MRSTIGTGHVSRGSIGSGPHVHTVAGVGSGAAVLERRCERADGPSGREAARVPPAPVVVVLVVWVVWVRAPG
jgi:hypothetical protein